ncbi:hypothetical protein BJX68DRAFT_267601 [Aspergillus pseudodeflectus]|uniref:Uncharacterized protein n=1 Tax=Aspergillus pseudodeflectus TaxID=176178 RepID=A0ABR4K8Y3_9EURO
MNPLSSFYSITPTLPTPPPTLFWALTLLTTTTYITTLTSKTLTGSATAWLRPLLTTRRRRNLALAFYIAVVLLEFLQSEWIMAGDWSIASGMKAFAAWVVARGKRGDGNQSPGWIELLGPLAGLLGRIFVICNTGTMVFLWLGMAVKELASLHVDGDGVARRGKGSGERKE